MRVIHIIPAAFEYFDDIRSAVFELVEAEGKMGLDVEAYTLQYGPVSKRLAADVVKRAPSQTYQGMVAPDELYSTLHEFDVVHVHCPILGMLPDIIRFKQNNDAIPLVVTYHRPVIVSDLFALYILWYTKWYLPKLLQVADVLCTSIGTPRLGRVEPPRIEVEWGVHTGGNLGLAPDYFSLYHQLVTN